MSQTAEQQTEGSSLHEEEGKKKQKSRRPANTAFRQQRLKAWQPILTPKTVLPLFFAVGVVFAPIGGLLLWASSQVKELSIDYSQCNSTAPACVEGRPPELSQNPDARIPDSAVSMYFGTASDDADAPTWCVENEDVSYGVNIDYTVDTPVCRIQFYIPESMNPPVLLYYQLTNFYQNHRRYVSSFDQQQLEGEFRDNSSIASSSCDPLALNDDGKAYYPCGLIANSMFNDTYRRVTALQWPSQSEGNVTYEMTNNTVSWDTDGELYGTSPYNYSDVVPPPFWQKRYPVYNESFPFPNLKEDEPFQVWMRTAGLPTFSKLALRNDSTTMEAGRYQIDIYDCKYCGSIRQHPGSILTPPSRLPRHHLRWHKVNPPLNAYSYGWQKSLHGYCIRRSRRRLHCSRCHFHRHPPDQTKVSPGRHPPRTHCTKRKWLTREQRRKLGDHTYLSWNTDQPSSATATGRAPRPGDTA